MVTSTHLVAHTHDTRSQHYTHMVFKFIFSIKKLLLLARGVMESSMSLIVSLPLLPMQFVPLWMAPNLLTFIGWLLLMLNFLLLAYFDWDFNTSTNSRGLKRQPIPSSVWVFCGVSQLVSYALDGMDGKQARRTSSSTPLGKFK